MGKYPLIPSHFQALPGSSLSKIFICPFLLFIDGRLFTEIPIAWDWPIQMFHSVSSRKRLDDSRKAMAAPMDHYAHKQ